jgi:hypothetical protein
MFSYEIFNTLPFGEQGSIIGYGTFLFRRCSKSKDFITAAWPSFDIGGTKYYYNLSNGYVYMLKLKDTTYEILISKHYTIPSNICDLANDAFAFNEDGPYQINEQAIVE